ncbi:MAG: aspartate-semialdehyde dehydrogenase [Candidatus Pacearchaeota archaeon]
MKKIKAGVLGATGAVGQNYLLLLENHPWFEVSYVAASPKSAGKKYGEAVRGKWFMDRAIPENIESLVVGDATKPEEALGKCDILFSSYEGSKDEIKAAEMTYAKLGFPVISNNSAHRWTEDVPMIIPEINYDHIRLIDIQRRNRGFNRGFVVTKPNCSIQSYMTPIEALRKEGYQINKVVVTTLQALSGAGYPGVASLDILDNIIPYINGEEEKTEQEPLKIFGRINGEKIFIEENLEISATCTRVPVIDGHMAVVNVNFNEQRPNLDEIINIWNNFQSEPQRLNLPSAPKRPIIYLNEENRPQPRKDRDAENGMAVVVGRLRECNVHDVKFVGLSHNTIRGAAGGAILTAELLHKEGYF